MASRLSLYVPSSTPLHRIDPRAKFLLLALVLGLSVANDQLFKDPLIGLFTYAYLLGLMLVAKLPSSWIRAGLYLSVLFMVTNVVFWSPYYSGKGAAVLYVPLLNLSLTDFGLRFSLIKGFLVANPVMASILTFTTTSPQRLLQGLQKVGVPFTGAFTLILALRLIPYAVSELREVMEAQMLRGLELQKGGPIKRIRNHIPVFIPLFVRMMRGIFELAVALECKGLGAVRRRTFAIPLKFGRLDAAFVALSCLVLVLPVLLRAPLHMP
jgi:energy-coupling factor transport system permease protein